MRLRAVLFLLSLPGILNAQSSIDIFTISGFYGFSSKYDAPLAGKATESGSLINLKIPLKMNNKTIWYNDFTHTYFEIRTNLDPQPASMLTSVGLDAFIFQTGIVRKLNERNGFQFLIVPRYTTDFNGRDRKNWQLGFIALYEYRKNEKLLMRYGVLYNKEMFGPLLVPLVYLDWKCNDRWSIVGLMPINLKVNYRINDFFVAGFSHFGFTTTYRIGQDEFRSDYIERASIDETLFIRWKVIGNIHLETRLGYSLGRHYAHYAADEKMDLRLSIVDFGNNRLQKNIDFNSGPIASVRIVYNVLIK